MLSVFERKIISKYLFSSKKEGFISFFAVFSFIGIALGVATLIIVMSVMNGFRQNLLGAIIGMRPHVMVFNQGEPLKTHDPIINKIKDIEHVNGSYPMLEKQNVLFFKGQARGVMIQGLTQDCFRERKSLCHSLEQGQLNDFEKDSIIIGYKLAEELDIQLYDHLSLMTPEGTQTAFGTMPRQKSFKVVGIFNYGMRDYDKSYVFMPLNTAQSFYQMNDVVHYIGVFTDSLSVAPFITQQIKLIGQGAYRVIDWKHQDNSIFHAVEVEKNVMFLILTLLIIIAGFNITSSLVMLVKDKTKSIGILKTIGATNKSIGRIFTSIGLFIGLFGTMIGLTLGTLMVYYIENIRRFLETLMQTELFSAEIYYLTKLPAVLVGSDVLIVCIIAVSLSVIASFFPARKAAKLNPIEALSE